MLNEKIKLNEEKVINIKFEGNPGYVLFGKEDMLIAEGYDFDFNEYDTVLVELPNGNWEDYDGNNEVAIYAVIETMEIDDEFNSVRIIRIK